MMNMTKETEDQVKSAAAEIWMKIEVDAQISVAEVAFILGQKVPGIDFKTATAIAESLGEHAL